MPVLTKTLTATVWTERANSPNKYFHINFPPLVIHVIHSYRCESINTNTTLTVMCFCFISQRIYCIINDSRCPPACKQSTFYLLKTHSSTVKSESKSAVKGLLPDQIPFKLALRIVISITSLLVRTKGKPTRENHVCANNCLAPGLVLLAKWSLVWKSLRNTAL